MASTMAAARVETIPAPRMRALLVPREHGAWGMLLIPFFCGAGVGIAHSRASYRALALLLSVILMLFVARTALESSLRLRPLKARSSEEQRLTLVVACLSVAATLPGLVVLAKMSPPLVFVGAIAAGALCLNWMLARDRGHRIFSEIVGAIALTSTSAAAYCVATGKIDAIAWLLWSLNWMFAGTQIAFVHVRLRTAKGPGRETRWRSAGWLLGGQCMIALGCILAWAFGYASLWLVLAFMPITFARLLWCALPPRPLQLKALGFSELVHAIVFGILLIPAVR